VAITWQDLLYVRGPFEKFVDLLYFSESELCGGAVTVSFSKYFLWQATHFLQRCTHFSKTCCRPLITSKFLASELPFHGWKSPEIAWGRDLNCMADVLMGFHRSTFSEPKTIQFRSRLMRFLSFSNHEKEVRGKKFRSGQLSAERFREVGGEL
jgi:hypothetical protein